MASATDVCAALEKFELDLIDKQWSDDIWTSDFTACPDDLPDEFSEKFSPLSYCDIIQVIDQADKVIRLWLNEGADVSTQSDSESNTSSVIGPSWTVLQDIDYRALLSIIYFYTCKGQINNQDATAVHTCIKATNFYFTLLTIPGSDIYKVFNLTLFEKCLETLSLHKYLEIATGRMIKKTKQKKNDDVSSDDEFLEMDETLTLSQQQNVVRLLNVVLSTFQELINKFSFKKYPEALNMSLSTLAELTRIERNSTMQEFSCNNDNTSFCPFSRNAYLTMRYFCSDLHGRVSEIVRLVLYYLMPNLSLIGGPAIPEMAKFNNKELTNIRNIAVSFVAENIITMGEGAHHGLKILIQQMCFNMIDRADYRTKACEMIVLLLCKLPMELYYSLIRWIFCLSLMEGAHHRVIGLELLSRLILMKPGTIELSQMSESYSQHLESQLSASQSAILQNRSESQVRNEITTNLSQERIISFSQPINYVPLEYRRAMLAIIIDRMRDEAAIVRTRALSILADLIANKTSPSIQQLLQDIFIKPYREVTMIDDEFNRESDFLKWKTFIAALDKVRDTEVNKSMIPGGRAIVCKVFEKCLDERVNVRKSALLVISRIFKLSSKWMTDAYLELFGRHCRDPALSIRKEMVGIVTELMLFFPGHEPLTKLWVEEVVPQITDREIRVQEQVLQVFTHTILNNLTTFERMKTPKDELPWKLLDRIAQQKMRSFLVTACALWSKSGLLSQNVIKTLKTHIGTINDNPAWIFLSSVSEYVDIEKPDVIMRHYLDFVAQDRSDPSTAHLVLITLNNCWHKLRKDEQEIVQNDIYNYLRSFSVHPSLVNLAVDIATAITVVTAEDELTGKQEVAKWAMEMIQNCESHLENCLKPSQESLAECSNCINIVSLLGALAGICPEKIKETTFMLLYDFLMKGKIKKGSFQNRMRAITVITLAKMALRSDFFARSLVAGLAQLLATSPDPVLLNNVIVAIADIGERYANLIEPLISSICVCLKSEHKTVKEITLILLIELLQEDYLKARGALVFHLLSLINDSDPRAVNIVKYYFTNCLLARHPYKMYQLLLPATFHFNNYASHPDYPKLEMEDAEWNAFDMSGGHNHQKRMNIYQFMLANVPDMVRMKCLHFICTVILNGVADNIISLKSKNGEQLLFDALSILLTKEIKIEYNELVRKKNEDGEDEDDQKQNPLYKLGKQMFSAAQKKEIIETIIPICCKLKKKLLAENRKLLPYLHKFVRELVKDYKDEINEIFKEDKQFGIEILHEINHIAEAEALEEEEEDENEQLTSDKNSDKAEEVNVVQTHISAVIEERTSKRSMNNKSKNVDLVQEETECGTANEMEMVVEEVNACPITEVPVAEKPASDVIMNEAAESADISDKENLGKLDNPNSNEKDQDRGAPSEAAGDKRKGRRIRQPSNTSLIEEYDEEKHGQERRRNSDAEWMLAKGQSICSESDVVPKQMDVRVCVERLRSSVSSSRRHSEPDTASSTKETLNPIKRLNTRSASADEIERARLKTEKKGGILITKELSISLSRLNMSDLALVADKHKNKEPKKSVPQESSLKEQDKTADTGKEIVDGHTTTVNITLERVSGDGRTSTKAAPESVTKRNGRVAQKPRGKDDPLPISCSEDEKNIKGGEEVSKEKVSHSQSTETRPTSDPKVTLERLPKRRLETKNRIRDTENISDGEEVNDIQPDSVDVMEEHKNAKAKKAVVRLKKLTIKDEKRGEKPTAQEKPTGSKKKNKSSQQVSISLKRLSEKDLSSFQKGGTSRSLESDEDAIEKGVGDIVMPPPTKSGVKRGRRSLVGTRKVTAKAPATPDGSRKSIMTSTPVVSTSNYDFENELSAIGEDM